MFFFLGNCQLWKERNKSGLSWGRSSCRLHCPRLQSQELESYESFYYQLSLQQVSRAKQNSSEQTHVTHIHKPFLNEGVLNVAVWIVVRCGPASLHSKHKISWYLYGEIPNNLVNNSMSKHFQSSDFQQGRVNKSICQGADKAHIESLDLDLFMSAELLENYCNKWVR